MTLITVGKLIEIGTPRTLGTGLERFSIKCYWEVILRKSESLRCVGVVEKEGR